MTFSGTAKLRESWLTALVDTSAPPSPVQHEAEAALLHPRRVVRLVREDGQTHQGDLHRGRGVTRSQGHM